MIVSSVFPVLVIVIVEVIVEYTVALPNVRLPLTSMMRMGTGAPSPEMAAVFVPLVMSEATVTVPLYDCTTVGLNDTVMSCELLAAIVPFVQFPLNPTG